MDESTGQEAVKDTAGDLPKAAAADSLDSKLRMKRPSEIPASESNPRIGRALGMSYNKDDLTALYGAREFSVCETTSIGPSPFAKNFSNFGAECFKKRADRYYLNTDVVLRKNAKASGRPEYKWAKTKPTDVFDSTSVGTRFVSRSVTEAANGNETVRNLLAGTLAFNFSLGGAWEAATVPSREAARPRYVLQVVQTRKEKPTRLVASAGMSDMRYATRDEANFEVGTRSIVEEWDAPTPVRNAEPAVRGQGYGARVSRTLGVAKTPFATYGARFDRRSTPKQEVIAARLAEGNDMVFVEMSNLLGRGELGWGYRIPYFRHSISVRYAKLGAPAVSSYGYLVNDNNRADLSYDTGKRSYAASFVSQL